MKVFDLDKSQRWLFCMTHPDDEISIAAWIKRLTNAGADVFMSWTHDTPVREQEARIAADLLGVPQDRLFFLHGPDGRIIERLAPLREDFAELMNQVKPDRVACGAFEQGHLDHDGTNWLVNQTFEGPVLEIPFYHAYVGRLQTINRFASSRGEEVIRLSQKEQEFKIRLAKCYPSTNIWSVLLWYEIFKGLKMRPARLRITERMRLQTHHDFNVPNLPPRLCRRVQNCGRWQRWQRALESVDSSTYARIR